MISLLYHDVVEAGQFSSSGFGGGDADIYKLERAEFEAHLSQIEHRGQRVNVRMLRSPEERIGADELLFTFDDGGHGALLAAELLEQHGWRGHFFIPTDYLGKPGFLVPDEVRQLHNAGHIIGSHSCSHPARISHCPPAQIEREWKQSVQVLSELLGSRVQFASVPGGFYSRPVAEAAAVAGIRVLFNSEPTERVQRVGECMVLGRYSIQHGDSADKAARLAIGDPRLLRSQSFAWNAKKLAKRLGGNYYLAMRKFLLRNSAQSGE